MKLYCNECEELFEIDDEYDFESKKNFCSVCGAEEAIIELLEITCLKCGEIWEGCDEDCCPSCNSIHTQKII